MRDLPDHDRLYAALLARDPAFEGQALVGVISTGIFCRLTCPARKPRPENCRWFTDAEAARTAGFRPCKRCQPGGEAPALIATLTAALEADPARRWTEANLAALGHDPSTVRRLFRRQFGQSFLQMARAARLRAATGALKDSVIAAQLDAGFESASGFRAAFRRLFGHAPQEMRVPGVALADWIDTPLGPMIAIADDSHLHLLEYTERKALPQGLQRISAHLGGRIGLGRTAITDLTEAALAAYLAGQEGRLDLPVRLHGTAFQCRVWQALQAIPAGETRSYGQIAAAVGAPAAVRAVAAANAANRLALVVPCHRVIGADGQLQGYAGGIWRKRRLIEIETAWAGKTQEAG